MNILLISPSYFPIKNGTEQVIYELVSRLKQDNKIIILTVKWEKGMPSHEMIDGINIYRTKFINSKLFAQLTKYLGLFLSIISLNVKHRFDCIHMFHIYDTGGAAYLAKKLLKIPLLITLAGWDTYSPIRKVPKRSLPIIRLILNTADSITAPSHHLAQAGSKQGCKRKIKVIPHGSSMHNTVNDTTSEIISHLNLQNNKIILSVQRLHPAKGLGFLLNAIPDIIKREENCRFIIVGKGDEEKNLKELVERLEIKPQVIFTGFIEHNRLPLYYSIADLFVLPTLYESFGLVYIDALCFGVPIITTENGGSLDIVTPENGILVPPKDSGALSNAILNAFDKKWDNEAIKMSAEKYRWENIVNEYLRLYSLIAHKQPQENSCCNDRY